MTLARPPFSLLDVTANNESDTAQHSTHEFLAFLLRKTSSKIPGELPDCLAHNLFLPPPKHADRADERPPWLFLQSFSFILNISIRRPRYHLTNLHFNG